MALLAIDNCLLSAVRVCLSPSLLSPTNAHLIRIAQHQRRRRTRVRIAVGAQFKQCACDRHVTAARGPHERRHAARVALPIDGWRGHGHHRLEGEAQLMRVDERVSQKKGVNKQYRVEWRVEARKCT